MAASRCSQAFEFRRFSPASTVTDTPSSPVRGQPTLRIGPIAPLSSHSNSHHENRPVRKPEGSSPEDDGRLRGDTCGRGRLAASLRVHPLERGAGSRRPNTVALLPQLLCHPVPSALGSFPAHLRAERTLFHLPRIRAAPQ